MLEPLGNVYSMPWANYGFDLNCFEVCEAFYIDMSSLKMVSVVKMKGGNTITKLGICNVHHNRAID